MPDNSVEDALTASYSRLGLLMISTKYRLTMKQFIVLLAIVEAARGLICFTVRNRETTSVNRGTLML